MTMNRWISDLHWRREGRYSRSERTQDALLDAAELLVLERGAENISVKDITKKSGCSVGSFYHQFKDKKALFYALYDRIIQVYQDTVKEGLDPARWEGASIREIIHSYLEFALSRTDGRPEFKVADMLVSSNYPELREHYGTLIAEGNRQLQRLLLERRAEIGHDDPELASGLVVDQIANMVRARQDQTHAAAMLCQTDDETYIALLVEGACRFLLLEDKRTG